MIPSSVGIQPLISPATTVPPPANWCKTITLAFAVVPLFSCEQRDCGPQDRNAGVVSRRPWLTTRGVFVHLPHLFCTHARGCAVLCSRWLVAIHDQCGVIVGASYFDAWNIAQNRKAVQASLSRRTKMPTNESRSTISARRLFACPLKHATRPSADRADPSTARASVSAAALGWVLRRESS